MGWAPGSRFRVAANYRARMPVVERRDETCPVLRFTRRESWRYVRGMKTNFPRRITALALLSLAGVATAQDVNLKWIGKDASKDLGGYMPQRLKVSSTKPESLKKAPDGLATPIYGEMKIGPRESQSTCVIIVDEPADKPTRLYVDTNLNGDLTDDPAPNWEDKKMPGRNGKDVIVHVGDAEV